MMYTRIARTIISILLILIAAPEPSRAATVTLPLTIDYPLLRSLVVKTAFTEPGPSAVLIDQEHGCWEIRISEPRFSEENGRLRFETRVLVHAGIFTFGNCILPVDWDGYLVLHQVPKVNSRWVLSFDTVDSSVYDRNRKQAAIAGLVWNLVKTSVHQYLESITVNLAPPVLDLKGFMEHLFSENLKQRADRMTESMRPGSAQIEMDALRIPVLTDIEGAPGRESGQGVERLTEAEMQRLVKDWETWDAYLVLLLTSLSRKPLTPDDRHILLNVLLETRYRFIAGLTDGRIGGDFVREQFVWAWKELAPVFRSHLGDDPSRDLLGYLAFFTASDALIALDDIGPSLGIEISREGLVRLARMILEEKEVILDYTVGVDEALRELLGFGKPLPEPDISIPGETIEPETDQESSFMNRLIPSAWAATAGAVQKERSRNIIKKWVFKDPEKLASYMKRIKELLSDVVHENPDKENLAATARRRLPGIVFSTAWQESCFRQFIIKGSRITYLRSYNKTSVGLMQINEFIWRGFYDRNHLRWDIRYNAAAGCEILSHYIRKYALARLKKRYPGLPLDDRAFAGLIYAMYNGGPGQFEKFLTRRKTGNYFKTDRLFSEKFDWVAQKEWGKIRICLKGESD